MNQSHWTDQDGRAKLEERVNHWHIATLEDHLLRLNSAMKARDALKDDQRPQARAIASMGIELEARRRSVALRHLYHCT